MSNNKILSVILFVTVSLVGLHECVNAQVYRNVTEGSDRLTIRAKNSGAEISGNPYLFDKWLPTKVTFADGSAPTEKEAKFDALEGVLVIKGPNQTEQVFSSPVASFSMQVGNQWLNYACGFKGKQLEEKDFVQILFKGKKVAFYKAERKGIVESKSYNSPTVTQKIDSQTHYYIQLEPNNNTLQWLKRDQKSILAALNRPELEAYVKSNKPNFKKDEDLAQLLTYFDSL